MPLAARVSPTSSDITTSRRKSAEMDVSGPSSSSNLSTFTPQPSSTSDVGNTVSSFSHSSSETIVLKPETFDNNELNYAFYSGASVLLIRFNLAILTWTFILGSIPSKPEGDYIDKIHQQWFWDYEKLESHHDYIQWCAQIPQIDQFQSSVPT